MEERSHFYHAALEDFNRVRRRAVMEQLLARLSGRSADLLDYDDVRRKLRLQNTAARGLQEIPVDAIVGSVGRVQDFTRSFMPKQSSDARRWARVKAVMTDMTGVPPIEVYQVGDAYFVIDGNHRVSVARELGAPTIQAYVTEVKTRVPLTTEDDWEALIAKERYAEFLEATNLDRLRPEADLQMTMCGQYRVLLEHIAVHRHFLGIEQEREIPYGEAVTSWYDHVYLPLVQLIRERGVLRDFPQRTEADLYLLLAEHRAGLQEALGWQVGVETAVSNMAQEKSPRPERVMARLGEKLIDTLLPDELESGPQTGVWRKERLAARHADRLFQDILVALNGTEAGWQALAQAITFAQQENGRLLGLHVTDPNTAAEDPTAATAAIEAEFMARCRRAGVAGQFALESGQVARQVVARAVWSDLVTLPVTFPPEATPLARLASGLRTILLRTPRPILAVPAANAEVACRRALLAYDEGSKANEALFVAAYLAGKWGIELVVVSVGKGADAALSAARVYLETHGVTNAHYHTGEGGVESVILETAAAHDVDFLLTGGIQAQPLVQLMLGSTVEALLRARRYPLLLCR